MCVHVFAVCVDFAEVYLATVHTCKHICCKQRTWYCELLFRLALGKNECCTGASSMCKYTDLVRKCADMVCRLVKLTARKHLATQHGIKTLAATVHAWLEMTFFQCCNTRCVNCASLVSKSCTVGIALCVWKSQH